MSNQNNYTVLFWGTYEADYPRNKILIAGLRAAGVTVRCAHKDVYAGYKIKTGLGWLDKLRIMGRYLKSYLGLIAAYFKDGSCDLLYVAYPGYLDLGIAWLLTRLRRKPLVFDCFYSLYDSLVWDRKLYASDSFAAKMLYWLDRYNCLGADLVLLDTRAHIDYFVETFKLPKERFECVYIGADQAVFVPQPSGGKLAKKQPFTALFHGKFIPLQGIETIVRAAALVQAAGIKIDIIGTGQTLPQMQALAASLGAGNLNFCGWATPAQIVTRLAQADVGLGIFGLTGKAQRVVPNKAYEILACARPLITAGTPAIAEVLTDREQALLVPAGDDRALAQALLELQVDPKLAATLARNGYNLFTEQFTAPVLGEKLATRLKLLLQPASKLQ